MKTVKIEERGECQWKKTGTGGHAEKRGAEELYPPPQLLLLPLYAGRGEEYNGELRKGENEEEKGSEKNGRRMEMGDSAHIREK